jgi:hypothetical protein
MNEYPKTQFSLRSETFAYPPCFDVRAREKDMNGNLIHSKRRVLIDGWPLLVGFALYWVALAYFALTLASGILVA